MAWVGVVALRFYLVAFIFVRAIGFFAIGKRVSVVLPMGITGATSLFLRGELCD